MHHFEKAEAKKEIINDEVLLSKERRNPIIFVLYSGRIELTHNFEWENEKYNISFFNLHKKQYFGYESFTPDIKNIEFIAKAKSIISAFPLNDFSEIIDYNTKLFPILIKDLFNKSKKYTTVINQIISKINQLNGFNQKMASLIMGLKIKLPEKSPLTPYMSNPIPINLDNVKNFIHSKSIEPKYREFNLKGGFILDEFFQPDVIEKLMEIITTRKKIGKILFENQIDELAKFHFFFEKTLKDLIRELKVFYTDENSFIKLLKKNENKIPSKHYNFFFNLTNFFKDVIFENDFFKKIIPNEKYDNFLNLNIEENKSVPEVTSEMEDKTSQNNINLLELFDQSRNEKTISREIIKKFKMYNQQYIQFTKEVCKKMKQSLTPEETDFIHFGIYDNLLTDEQIKMTKALVNEEIEKEKDIEKSSVFYFYQWVEQIIEGLQPPSNNDLGMSYRKHLLHLERFRSKKRNQPKNEIESKLNFEIDNMFTNVMNSFNREALSIYPLNKINFPTQNPKDSLITREVIKKVINEIKSKDFTVFFRETLLNYKNKNQIIQFEVEPIFVIIPAISSQIVFWQEMVENKKKSQARFFLPLYYVGSDFKKNMISAIAAYRWEICRSVKGVNWLDPVDGGITGSMVDYLSFYKKNSSLSFEQKERISNLKKKFRNDNKRLFSHLYFTWLEYEHKGVLRLNDIEREIFCKHIPFGKNIRDRLIKLPLYEKYIGRYNNIAKRELEVITRRLKRL